MSTNYYLHEKTPCKSCGREFDSLHIGKSSAGWCFSLRIIPEDGINDLSDWVLRWSKQGVIILDEYGDKISPDDMYLIITARSHSGDMGDEWLLENGATRGPNGLARHAYGALPGDGTYDLCTGEFPKEKP